MSALNTPKFLCLVVLDGWGIAPPGPGNAIELANTPNMDRLWASFPHTQLKASGEGVGLPKGEAGNTETGHLNLGAGRIVYQDLPRINMSIADQSFFENPAFLGAIDHVNKFNSKLHIMGLIGFGGVHSNIEHLYAIIHLAAKNNVRNFFLHLFTDGRDSSPTAARTILANINDDLKKEKVGQIASIMGRFWAMDRDLRWERTAKAYFALTRGQANLVKNAEEAIEISYTQGVTDEFIQPSIITDREGKPLALIQDNDAAIFFNFRVDRPRQLARSFVLPDFETRKFEYEKKQISEPAIGIGTTFQRGSMISNLYFVTMTNYEKILEDAGAHIAFPPEMVNMPIGRVISENGLNQVRMSESEKERFVSFYFNGLRGTFPREEKIIIPSVKVATYDLKPEMSARELTDELIKKIRSGMNYSFILINFANADMIGHTGNIGATVSAIQVVDECVGKISNVVLGHDGALLITSDHGNAEEMINPKTGDIDTEHSTFPVPFIIVSREFLGRPATLEEGILADVAPTALGLMNIIQPTSMTGRNLLSHITR
ncbi:phosphoglycerate mutase (2,3-diphosphoglycerate-independent) [Candidatus Woesebacteria bacterium RIFCSPHIGHO2_02_FULL_38_9]|uniref:2,3-bisphosphoglycerate-independent phosphoglycerate mutase n=1 Tax=Candidatus Woesebacteria bacterium RIFCSPHIGHO2_01_FULL_39_28 TaxID=1802496 RepID=A0A1F7YIS9_9BACT|nr:MAG: phosphoglycerate mutase (2,3-diphosphoglycerate-independent) [Candidatus Woesebacteria bacterium RIFCSPHIGHO2_01_FULL_39_28]OGM31822.1 MAG: phosphoglycerate mutase (2,3-diphosphoglycerate-independent) [Candidatus Woesebacteria bacterium RIFCSPHIGHO2_02_FULL_38_9]OGM56955.1 MAG: phosphoglycerate mutase (2,3-diphosphoglycerate-independent) [Candidatus Woesebacteria bacterium RIFCSPLOWO2_01_FULL_38_20]